MVLVELILLREINLVTIKKSTDILDKACMNHDKCYEQCRENFACNEKQRGACMTQCDRDLGQASQNSKISNRTSYARKYGLEVWMNNNSFPDAGKNSASCYENLTHINNKVPSVDAFFNAISR